MPASIRSAKCRTALSSHPRLTDIPPEVFAKRIFPRLIPDDQFEALLQTSKSTRRYVLQAAANIHHSFSSALVLHLEAHEKRMDEDSEARLVRGAATRLIVRHAITTPTLGPWVAAQPNLVMARTLAKTIHHAWLTGQPELNLKAAHPVWTMQRDGGISGLPEEMRLLTKVTRLTPFSIAEIGLPPQIFTMTWLKELDLRGLGLTRLPDALANLLRLEGLTLERNRFLRLPPVVLELRALHWLVIEQGIVEVSEPSTAKTLADRKIRCLQTSFFRTGGVSEGYWDLDIYSPWPRR